MIGRITGIAIDKAPDGCCVLDVHGVGYEVFVPVRSLSQMPAPPTATTLHVHTHAREDMLRLYGFETELDRAAFRVLLGVAGVGPKLAMALLGELSATELSAVVARADKKRLAAVSGIGKRTAERLVLELKGKLPMFADADAATAHMPAPPQLNGREGRAGEVAGALVALGFTRAQADAAADKVVQQDDARPVETLIRQALATLG